MIYLDYAKAVAGGYILNFFADTEEDITEVSNGKHFITKNGIDYGIPQPSSTIVITMPDKTKKTYVLNEAGEWQEGGVEMDYSKLTNVPITLANLAEEGFEPEANTYYEHLGETTEDFIKGIIYLYDGKEYKAIDGSGSGAGVQADYNQNDSTAADYIKNRPFYDESNLTEIADFKVISGNLKEVGSEVTVEYNGDRFTGTVTESSGTYELRIEGSEQIGFGGQVNITDEATAFYYSHKKTYEIKSDDEVVFNGVKYLTQLFTSGEMAGKFYISDGEIDPETLSPVSAASFIYLFNMAEEGEFILDYYVIYKSTTNIDFNIKTGQQTIKTIDPKFIKDMYYETTVEMGTLLEQTFTTSVQPIEGEPDLNFWETTDSKIPFVEGETIKVLFNGTEYTETVKKKFGSILYVGNIYIFTREEADNTGEPFAVANTAISTLKDGTSIITEQPQTNATIKVYKSEDIIKTIDPKYIKDMYYTKPESDVQKTLVFKGEITLSTQEAPSLFEVGDIVFLKEEAAGLDVVNEAKSAEVNNGTVAYIGNLSLLAEILQITGAVDTKEDYCALCGYGSDGSPAFIYYNKIKEIPNNIEVYKGADPIVRIPEKYLPLDIAKKSYVDTAISNAITKTLNTEV